MASSAPGSSVKVVSKKKFEASRRQAAQKFAKAAALEEQREQEQKVENQIAEIVAELRACPEKISRTLKIVQGDFLLHSEGTEDRCSSNMYEFSHVSSGVSSCCLNSHGRRGTRGACEQKKHVRPTLPRHLRAVCI